MKKYLYLAPFVLLAACAGRDPLTTAHDLEIKLNGSDAAYCVLSTQDNRYALRAPGTVLVERDDDDLKIDCNDNNSDRRRTVMVSSDFTLGYWTYPETVTVDFASSATNAIDNGFRLAPTGKATEVLTEKSYSAPVNDIPVNLTINDDMARLKEIEIQAQQAMPNEIIVNSVVEPVTPVQQPQNNGRRSYPILTY